MYINFWYPIAASRDLTDKPMHLKMLGCEFVAFRDNGGKAHCLSNICVHRGASLAHGKIKGDAIECPYHGWLFRGQDGVCTKIPSLGKDGKIPARAKVDSYPVDEKYGLVFAFLGDLPADERPPIMDVPEWGKDGWGFTLQEYRWTANFQRAVENTLDPAHTEFVHPSMGYQGEREDYDVPDLKLMEQDWGVGTMTTFVSPDLPGEKMKGLKGEGQMEAGAGSHGVSSTWTYLHFGPKAWAHQYGFTCPVDERHIRRFFLQARNFRLGEQFDPNIMERNNAVSEQDREVIERVEPFFTPASSTEEVIVPADLVIVKYREMLKKWDRAGWKIDVDRMKSAGDGKAWAIPSPARRHAKGWAIEPVPLMASDADSVRTAPE